MQWFRLLGLGLLFAGAALIAASVATGEGQVYLLLIFPVFTSTGALGILGIIAVFGGLFLVMTSGFWRAAPIPAAPPTASPPPAAAAPAARPRYGGVVMLGPIPIVWGSDPTTVKWMVLLGLILLAVTVAVWALLLLR